MDDHATTGAMTEIALALAMAFFCLLVLALASVGLAPTPLTAALEAAAPGAEPRPMTADERLVLFHLDRFQDPAGATVDPASLGDGAPIVLAVDPALAFDRVLAARAAIPGAAVRIAPLDPVWLDHLNDGEPR
jgi:hypothetical protein